eukprot:3443059-Prymnesium_polylepis.1
MQFIEGDLLPIDVAVPSGINPDAATGPAAAELPQITPEQLVTTPHRSVLYMLGGLCYAGDIIEAKGDNHRRARARARSA